MCIPNVFKNYKLNHVCSLCLWPLAVSPCLVNIQASKNYSDSIHFVIPTSLNHRNCLFGIVT